MIQPPSPSATLRIADDLAVRFRSPSEFALETNARSLRGGPHTLAILNAFRTPTRFAAAITGLESQIADVRERAALSAEVVRFYGEGVLLDEHAAASDRETSDFAAAPIHIAMLSDSDRMRRYLAAIRRAVRPGDVVVDIGTGTGLLSVAAARAGASRVYAIEATGIARVAERVFAANGVADRVTLLEGRSTLLEVPERADVLIAEIIGNDPLEEQILESTCDAVRRFLKPGARLVPFSLEVLAAPAEVPADVRARSVVTSGALEAWRRDYGIDFSPLEVLTRNTPVKFYKRPDTIADWILLAEPRVLAAFDLTLPTQSPHSMAAEFQITRAGHFDAVVLWFRAGLSADNVLSTDPRAPRDDNHWLHPVYMVCEPRRVAPGARAAIAIPGGDDRSVQVTVSP